ncbi:MAG: hypothetical protein A2283_20105 [Lentisphaerae bacterium RIFOXYA12_FULL_48_11]|nr:MAG: hypothetical protein A2283_20105 [Lentisphaerae bacterium RIFOXYA12_FULL_48_11]
MKTVSKFIIVPVMVSIVSGCSSGFLGQVPVIPAEAIKEVQAGQRHVARAEWWGFDPADSTRALQSAIDSGVRKLIVGNMGQPWVVDKIQLAGDQEIVFEKGTVVQARRGAFKGKADSLFTASLKQNITLTGYGAALRMWRQDYDDPAQYEHAEWRHTLSIRSCSNVKVLGLTLAESGGDGIYLGVAKKGITNKDIQIKDVICVDHYRQGISVISAENLLIEKCILKNTAGTAPMAGIDFEPNDADEKLVNCVMRDCVSENNKGDAYEFYLKQLKAESAPISIRLENCRSVGCRRAVGFTTDDEVGVTAVGGIIEFINCRFENSLGAGIAVNGKPAGGCRVSFKNCEIRNCLADKPEQSPIQISSLPDGIGDMGGIAFENCKVVDTVERLPLSYKDMSGDRELVDITGRLSVERNGHTSVYKLDKKQIDAWFPGQAGVKAVSPFNLKGVQWKPFGGKVAPGKQYSCMARLRDKAEYLLWADSGQEVNFVIQVDQVGKGKKPAAKVKVITPSGKEMKLADAVAGQKSYTFKTADTGACRLICEQGSDTIRISTSTTPVSAYYESGSMHLFSSPGEYFFYVPAGVKEFIARVAGSGPGELVKAALVGPTGKVVEEKDNIEGAHKFHVVRQDVSKGECWSIRFVRPSKETLEDFYINLRGIPPVIAGSREALLIPSR